MLAVLGTGLLGSGFVEALLDKGHAVGVWNRTRSRLAPLLARGAVALDHPRDAGSAERIHLVLRADDAVDATLAALGPTDAPVVDHSTNLPHRVAERYARMRAAGVRYTHAPVVMGPGNARSATGLMLVCGEDGAALEPVLATMTGKVWNLGPRPDHAAVYKLLGNGALLSLTGVMGDLLKVGAGQGLPPDEVIAFFERFKPQGWTPMIAPRILASATHPPSFELAMALKDVELAIQSAGDVPLAVLPGVRDAMQDAVDSGSGDRDFAIYAR